MPIDVRSASWWGAPKKFDRPQEDRRISWLELFYDLVYVIAISRITHHFSLHISTEGFIEYAFLFILIFWGWLNGSLYHDLHGNEGLRTRLMTLWQMMIIAALAVVLDRSLGEGYFSITVVFMIMQLYITYMWWSIGFYDKSHRQYNRPYSIFYLFSFILMGLSLFIANEWQKLILPLILLFNYAPPFVARIILKNNARDINLSSSMFERLGLLAIIVFGEVVLGVINGIGKTNTMEFKGWVNFALAISIVFALWWIFFTLVAQREAKGGFTNAGLLEMLFIPSLISLGLIAVSFTSFFDIHHKLPVQRLGYAVAAFLICISFMMELLVFSDRIIPLKKRAQLSLLVIALIFLFSAIFNIRFDRIYYLAGVLLVLTSEIVYLNSMYFKLKKREERKESV